MERGLFDGLDLFCVITAGVALFLYADMRLQKNAWRRSAKAWRAACEAMERYATRLQRRLEQEERQ